MTVPEFNNPPPSQKVLLCTTCRDSAKLICINRDVVREYALFRQGKLNRAFLDRTMERLVDHLTEMDRG